MHRLLCFTRKLFVIASFCIIYSMWMLTIVFIYIYIVNYSCFLKCIGIVNCHGLGGAKWIIIILVFHNKKTVEP